MKGDIRFDGIRRGSRSKKTSQFSSYNTVETLGGNERGGYRSQTSHSSSHNPGDFSILLHITGSYFHIDDIINENERGDSRSDGSRLESRPQEINHSSFHNDGKILMGMGEVDLGLIPAAILPTIYV